MKMLVNLLVTLKQTDWLHNFVCSRKTLTHEISWLETLRAVPCHEDV